MTNITSYAFVQQTCASEVRPESSHGKLCANRAFHWLVCLAGNMMHYRLLYRCAWLNTKGRNMFCVCFLMLHETNHHFCQHSALFSYQNIICRTAITTLFWTRDRGYLPHVCCTMNNVSYMQAQTEKSCFVMCIAHLLNLMWNERFAWVCSDYDLADFALSNWFCNHHFCLHNFVSCNMKQSKSMQIPHFTLDLVGEQYTLRSNWHVNSGVPSIFIM